MDDTLRTMIRKVINAGGKKTYSYGYATGPRRDGLGDGHLDISAKRKTYGKDEWELSLEAVKTVVKGRCWSNPEGLIFFQGRGLNPALLEKMAKTARKITGKPFEFSLPSEREEWWHAEASDADDDDDAEVPPSETEAAMDKVELIDEDAASTVADPTASAAAARLKSMLDKVIADGGRQTYSFGYAIGTRRDGNGHGHLELSAKSRAYTQWKHELEAPLQEVKDSLSGRCWSDAAGVVYFAGYGLRLAQLEAMARTAKNLTGKAFEFRLPGELEQRLRNGNPDANEDDTRHDDGAGHPVAVAGPDGGEATASVEAELAPSVTDPSGRSVTAWLERLREPLEQLRQTHPARAEKIATVVAVAEAELSKQQFGKALVLLQGAGKALDAVQPKDSPPVEPPARPPLNNVGAARLRLELKALRLDAVKALAELMKKVKGESDPRAATVADVVRRLALDMPAELEDALLQLDSAAREGDSVSVSAGKARVRQSAAAWLGFLQTRAAVIRLCEANPWGVALPLGAPARASLGAVLQMAR